MSWNTLVENWISLADRLHRDFPHLDAQALDRFRGDRAKFVTHLAETHQLTLAEAKEVLADWMHFKAPRDEFRKAA